MTAFSIASVSPLPGAGPEAAAVFQGDALILRCVDWILERTYPEAAGGRAAHWITCGVILGVAVLLRRLITDILFAQARRFFAKTRGDLQARLFAALAPPTAALIMVAGIIAALSVLRVPPRLDEAVSYGERAAATAVVLWGLLCAGIALIDHFGDVARTRRLGMAAFMPLLKKTFAVMFGIFAILMIAESLGIEVKAFLAGLGIGGLAFALAAQDTLANFFGSFVVVMDHPFLVGDLVRIGDSEGTVEDIGLRSTRLRTADRTLVVIPNKTVAGESIVNLSRMPERRVEQTIGLTYDTTPEQMEAILADIRALLRGDPGVHPAVIVANLSDFGDSSLNISILYYTANPEWAAHMAQRERVNLALMRAVAARGLEFAFPTRTLVHVGAGGDAPGDGNGKPAT